MSDAHLSQLRAHQFAGLRPGPHVLRVEPLDDADTVSFFSAADPTDVDFKAAFLDLLGGWIKL